MDPLSIDLFQCRAPFVIFFRQRFLLNVPVPKSIVYKETSKFLLLNRLMRKLKSQTYSQFNEFILLFVILLLTFPLHLCALVILTQSYLMLNKVVIFLINKALEQKRQNSSNNTNTYELQIATNLNSCGPSNKSPG